MRRREFLITAGAAAAWPLVASAQQTGTTKDVAVIMGWSQSNSEYRFRLNLFSQELTRLAMADHRTVQIEQLWTDADVARAQRLAEEVVAAKPDVILATTTVVVAALRGQTTSIPIVFIAVADPVGSKFVETFNHPGGNITGFVHTEAKLGGKWVALLKEAAPALARVAIMFNPDTAPRGGAFYLGEFEAAAKSLGVEPLSAPVRNVEDIQAAVAALGAQRGGLVLMDDAFMSVSSLAVIAAAARANVPTIFNNPTFAADGGLMAYSYPAPDTYLRAASYVERILSGERPADLPVQAPPKYHLAINLRTARALGLDIPPLLLAAADEVIE